MPKKNNTMTWEERANNHLAAMAETFHVFLSDECDIWPELKNWDYKAIYHMEFSDFHTKFNIDHRYYTYGLEGLFKCAAMKGATRDELVRIMRFILVIIDYQKYYLDIHKAKTDLGISSLFNKYMKSKADNGHW